MGPVVIGRDTRESGDWISSHLCDAISEGGGTVLDAGVLPTAAVSCAVVYHQAAAGIMITASHNPWHDNGIKILDGSGKKFSDIDKLSSLFGRESTTRPGTITTLSSPADPWCALMPQVDLSNHKILIDCANGAAVGHAPQVLASMGAEITEVGCDPNGKNINDGVGAMCPPTDLGDHDIAICLDGDADRLILVLPDYGVIDGDDILWILSQHCEGPVVGTVMTNGGLENALGDRLVRAKVGDQNVAWSMASTGAKVGTEPSGHVLFDDGLPTGDGLYSALRVLALYAAWTIPARLKDWHRLPTSATSVAYTGAKRDPDGLDQVRLARIANHRVITRYSGTEPVFRILVEGQDAQQWSKRIEEEFLS